ncbi:Centromere protein V [Bienertia sinuspersici]
MDSNQNSDLITHKGGCHCKRVRWEVKAPNSLIAWKCNCSTCIMRGNTHFIVPSKHFNLISGESNITTYTYGTHTAKHTFCNVCGITSFYTPRSNPDGVAVTLNCLDHGTVTHVEIRSFDGVNWDDSYSQTGISACSKLDS